MDGGKERKRGGRMDGWDEGRGRERGEKRGRENVFVRKVLG